MTSEMTTLDQALRVSERLSLADQLRLIGLLSERLRHPEHAFAVEQRVPL